MSDLVVTCCDGQDWCAVTCTSEILAGKWHAVVVHRLLQHGPMRFSRLQAEIQGVSKRVLSDTLANLQVHGIVQRQVIEGRPVRVEYSLTRSGHELRPVVSAMEQWGRTHRVPLQRCDTSQQPQ